MRYQCRRCPKGFSMFCQIATGCSIRAMMAAVAVSSLASASSSPQWRVHFSVMKYVDVPVFLFRGLLRNNNNNIAICRYAQLFVFFFFLGCTLLDAVSLMMLLTNANIPSLLSFRLVSHWSALQAQPLNISRWSFRFGFTWAILMNLRTILILYSEGYKVLMKQYTLLYCWFVFF